ncbi:hypothetical protein QOT17_019960 [Balamuthia mandrillaris]
MVEVFVNRTMKGTATRLGSKGGPYVLFRIAFFLFYFFVLASASQPRQTPSGSCLALNKTNDALLSQLDPKCVPLLLSSSNSIFLPSSQTLEDLLQQSLSFTRRLGVALPSSCRDASLRLSCHFVYKQCDEEEAAVVLSPCISVCEGMREECEEFFVATGNEDQLMACNTVLFPAPPICNNGSNEQLHVPYSQLDCPYPTVYRSTNEVAALQDPSQVCTLPCPGPIYTEEQWDIVFTIMTLFGGISLVLSCFYVATAFLNAETRKFPANLLPLLAAATIPISVGLLFGLFAGGDMRNVLCSDDGTAYQGVGEGEAGGLACVLQGSLMAFGGLLVACWWSIIGLNLMLLIVFQLERSKLNKLVPWYHGVAWTVPLVLTIIPLAAKKIAAAPTYPWCFIYDEDTDMWMYGCFYIWFIASWLFGSIMILVVLQYIYRRSYQFNTKGNMPLRHFIHLLMLLISFWVFTSFQIAYRFYGTGIKDAIQEAIEEQVFVFLQLFLSHMHFFLLAHFILSPFLLPFPFPSPSSFLLCLTFHSTFSLRPLLLVAFFSKTMVRLPSEQHGLRCLLDHRMHQVHAELLERAPDGHEERQRLFAQAASHEELHQNSRPCPLSCCFGFCCCQRRSLSSYFLSLSLSLSLSSIFLVVFLSLLSLITHV